ncbi:HK97-gp10 family putative phage morphogenesis protein [Enterococcus sp. LJL128]
MSNGFQQQADYFGRLSRVDPKKIAIESLEAAATFYLEQLLPNIPQSLLRKKHMREHIKVEIFETEVKVMFEDTAFYWRFAENGTVNQRAQHFASGTYQQNKTKIENIMIQQVMNQMEG